MKKLLVISLLVGFIALVGNWIGYKVPILEALPGMLILFAVVLGGYGLGLLIPKVATVVWITLLGMLLTSPISPVGQEILAMVSKMNFMALTTPALAYVGLSLGKEMDSLKSLSWKIVVVSLTVFTGTFLFSGVMAEIAIRMTGAH